MFRIVILSLICFLLSCSQEPELVYEAPPKCSKDWSEIADDSMLTVLAENSPASYFIYKGRNMGYEYELLHEFAKDMNVRLQVLMVNNLDEMQMKLDSCIGDIIACNLTVTPERKYAFNFSTPHLTTHQVLVQRDHPDSLITNFKQLRGKRIHVWQNSSFYENLVSLNEQQNLGIHIVKTEGDIISEELIRQVSEGEINYTVSDENVAKISMHYYDNLDISLAMSEDEEIAFAMRKGSEKLRDTINYWLNAKENQSTIGEVKRKYFKRRNLTSKANQNYSSLTGDQISPYDDVIKKESELIGWDWRLVSAIIYQESKFETWKRSWAGAFGIFQFMPETAEQYGISENSSPEAQIHAGCRKLNKNFNQWLEEVPDTNEAIMFTLATFNCGRGHIDDARALCDKYDLDKNKWDDNVAKMMLNLSNPKYYKDPVVRNGYCRGRETFKYPAEIMQRYEEYKSAFPDEPIIQRSPHIAHKF